MKKSVLSLLVIGLSLISLQSFSAGTSTSIPKCSDEVRQALSDLMFASCVKRNACEKTSDESARERCMVYCHNISETETDEACSAK